MKMIMKIVTVVLMATGLVYGRIGDTPTEFRNKIGVDAIAQGQISSQVSYVLYKKELLYTLVLFYDGKSAEEAICVDAIVVINEAIKSFLDDDERVF